VGPRAVLDERTNIQNNLTETQTPFHLLRLKTEVPEQLSQCSDYATDWKTEVRFQQGQGKYLFLFTTASRLALEPIQPPIQWVPGGKVTGS
jgi:hypothetical protein